MTHLLLLCLLLQTPSAAPDSAASTKLLQRRYHVGDEVVYQMKAVNSDSKYEVRITGTVTKREDGRFWEEFRWSDLTTGGMPQPLSEGALAFRFPMTLSPGAGPFASMPNFTQFPRLFGPIADHLTFYVDLYLAMNAADLKAVGDHVLVPNPVVPSWADGRTMVIGEDHVDFDITLTAIDRVDGVATIVIKHIPPKEPKVKLPADWMRTPMADTPNNFVQVRRTGEQYVAQVGKETFDVTLRVALADGKLLSAAMTNPVIGIERDCSDAALMTCGASRPYKVLRQIEVALVPNANR